MRAFLAVLGDSMRLLKARALFWISLGISAVTALIYLSIGFDEKGISLLFGAWSFENELVTKGSQGAALVYLGIYSNLIIGWWLSWIAIAIALISCAPIFPEFMSEGSAGVALSKPLSRLKLFFYKYVGALLFMGVQASLFAVIVFFAIKFRVGYWVPSVFWSVPILLLVFSYLYSITVLIGIKTRSVMAAVLLTVLFWFTCFLGQFGEQLTYEAGVRGQRPFVGGKLEPAEQQSWKSAHELVRLSYLTLPKTGETTSLMERWLVLPDGQGLGDATIKAARKGGMGDAIGEHAEQDFKRNPPWLVIGTSLGFEALVLGIAAWMFCRKDY